jgi:hypothetical protein
MVKLKRSECSVLPLVLKGKWYDMIASGEKTEEYRAYTPYWRCRISNWIKNRPIDGHLVIAFSRGYHKPDLFIEACGINLYSYRLYKDLSYRLYKDLGEPTGSHYVIALKSRVALIDDKKV